MSVSLKRKHPARALASSDWTKVTASLAWISRSGDDTFHDLTSSSLNRPLGGTVEGNRHRVGPVVGTVNFGAVEVDWEGGVVTLRLYDEHGVARIDHSLLLSSLAPAR